MALTLFKPQERDTHPTIGSEISLTQMSFNIHKFNNRPKPKERDRILIISCFCEFGCEIVGRLYCLPRLIKRFPGRYIIVMGWHGREYLYRHLVDEFWEVNDEFMWLRDRTYAFHYRSKNLRRLEQSAAKYGTVVPTEALGTYVVGNFCITCGKYWSEWKSHNDKCSNCQSTVLINSVFSTTEEYKKTAVMIPRPSSAKLDWAKEFIKPNTVAIFARGRRTYGRNLTPEFYTKLINLLESKGYNCIWMGEKQSTLPCPVDHVYDFSRSEHARDLEKTLAIISNCQFTIQFWTASSRLAGIMGVPFIIFESPEQIFCSGYTPGQEGRRLELTTFGPSKLVLSHYLRSLENQEGVLDLTNRAIDELVSLNTNYIIGLVEDEKSTQHLADVYYKENS